MKKPTNFKPDLELLRAVRMADTGVLSELCQLAGLDAGVDFQELHFSDLDFRDCDPHEFMVATDFPTRLSAGQVMDAANRVINPELEPVENTGFRPFLHSITDAVQAANAAYQRDEGVSGIPTGFHDLDSKISGLQQSELIVLAAAPSMGKTTLSAQIAYNVAKHFHAKEAGGKSLAGGKVGFYSLQLSAGKIAQRLLAIEANVPAAYIERGRLTEEEFGRYVQAARTLEALRLFIDDTSSDLETMIERAQLLHDEEGVDLLIVDTIDDLSEHKSGSTKFSEEIETVLRELKQFARRTNIAVLVTADLGKVIAKRRDKMPKFSDVLEISEINQFADTVLMLVRESVYLEHQKPSEYDLQAMGDWAEEMERVYDRAEILVAKQRSGPIGRVDLSFDHQAAKFRNLEKLWDETQA